jgi:hypothetical protein
MNKRHVCQLGVDPYHTYCYFKNLAIIYLLFAAVTLFCNRTNKIETEENLYHSSDDKLSIHQLSVMIMYGQIRFSLPWQCL